jgi:biopolymer transport protein ExbD
VVVVVVGVVVTGVVFVAPVTEVVVLLVALPVAVVALRRGAVEVEQPSAESATPTKRVRTQVAVADHLVNPLALFRS